MQYLFLLYEDENRFHDLSEDEARAVIGAYQAYTDELKAAGALVGGEPLEHSNTAVRVRRRHGRAEVEDGPFTDAKEQIGGFYRVEAADLDAALDWAARCPAAQAGRIEIRPIWNIGA